MTIKKGDIVIVSIKKEEGSVQNGIRPVIILQNNKGNEKSGTTIVAAITSKEKRGFFPTHVKVNNPSEVGLKEKSVIMLEQIFTIDKKSIEKKVGSLDERLIKEVNKAILISLDINLKKGTDNT